MIFDFTASFKYAPLIKNHPSFIEMQV